MKRRGFAAGMALVHLCLLFSTLWQRFDDHRHGDSVDREAPELIAAGLDQVADQDEACQLCAFRRTSWEPPSDQPDLLPSCCLEARASGVALPPSAAVSPSGLGPRGPPATSTATA